MNVTVKHSLPGRIRLHYSATEILLQQAVLAQTLIAVQDGIIDIQVNPKIASFLVYYDVKRLSEAEVLALFRVLSNKYLSDESLLASVAKIPAPESIFDVLASTLFDVTVRSLLPMPIRNMLLYKRIVPRIMKAAQSIFAGKFFSTDLLDATALTVAVLDGKAQTARFVATLLDMGKKLKN